MALEGPRIVYTRKEKEEETPLTRALRLAREVEELLAQTSSTNQPDNSAHSTRMARAMAAGLVDELATIARTDRKARLC